MQTQGFMTYKEQSEYFEKCLKEAVEIGAYPDNPELIDSKTLDHLWAIADAYPETKPELVKSAKDSWADYMSWLTS